MSSPTDRIQRRVAGMTLAWHSVRAERGLSLIELMVFVVIVSVGVAGILGVMNLTTKASADPLIQKQALAIGEAYLEEVLAMPFTYCDPDDANAATAESTGPVNPADPTFCASVLEGIGSEGENRISTTTPYDNVNDYASLPAGPPVALDGTPLGNLVAYTVTAAVVAEALGPGGSLIPANDANGRPQSLRATVTVTGPANTTVRLDGYRTRYAPNALP